MSPNYRYQVMPDLSPEAYAALKADIADNGVQIPSDVDEEGNILDGHQRKRACDELGIECPVRVLEGLTEAQKFEHAWRVNLIRRHLTREQKIDLACTWRANGLTQDRIAQRLGVSQSTVASWEPEFINSDELPHSPTVQGKDGKQYPRTKTRRRIAQLTEEANRPETPQIPSDTGERSAQALEQQETPQPRDTPAEAQSPTSELAVASDVHDALERLSLLSDEWHPVPVEQASSPLGSSPVLPAEVDAEGWVNALQDLSAKLETHQVQGGLLLPSTCWAPETRARGIATIQHMKEIFIPLEAVVGAERCETAGRNGHDDVDATPPPVLVPIADEAQDHENGELVTVSSAEYLVRDVADSHQPSPTRGEFMGPVPGASATLTEISGNANGAALVKPCSPEVPSNNHGADHDRPEQSSGSQEVCLDESSQLNSRKPKGSAGAGDLQTANVPASGRVAPSPLCPQCGSSNTWHYSRFADDYYACLPCMHYFYASTPGDVPSTPSQVSSHEMVQVASEEKPADNWVRDQQQTPPAPMLATGPITQDGIEPGTSEATVSSTAGCKAFGDEDTAHQEPAAGPYDDGETFQHECREIA